MGLGDIFASFLSLTLAFLQLICWYAEAFYRQLIPPPMKPIDGETILVTGAAGGIGKEICKQLLRNGSNIKLVLWDLHKPGLEKLASELKLIGNRRGHKIYPFAVDISKRENIDECALKVKSTVGPISILFNNAGITSPGNMLLQSNSEVDKTIQVNLMSHLWIIRQFLPDMVVKNHGRIINTCSMGGLQAGPLALPYVASKFAVNGYSESLKMELEMFGHDGIKVSVVYPYFVQTPLLTTLEFKKTSKLLGFFQNFLEPEHVGQKIVEGMRREYEYIYLPKEIPLYILISDFLLPVKARKAFKNLVRDNFAYKNEEEQKRIVTSFNDVVQAEKNFGRMNGNAEE